MTSRFNLTRYFSVASLVGVLAVLAVLFFFYRCIARHALMEHETRDNVALTRVFANTTWPGYSAFVSRAFRIPKTELPQRPELALLREDLQRQMRGLNVVKVKIYDLNGLTVFSTDIKQIGEDKSSNSGFLRARAGEAASDITFRHQFDAFEQVIVDRNLVFSYIPIRNSETSVVEGVFEVYSDVTELVADLEKSQWQILGGVFGSLALLYLFLFQIVRRADKIMIAAEDRILHLAYHDLLTGLPNRATFAESLDRGIKLAKRSGAMCAVMILDLDHFKEINDSLGHRVGDLLLQQVGERLKRNMREVDTVARLGGDEFGIALPEIKQVEQVAQVAEKIRRSIVHPVYTIEGHQLRITASIGISMYPGDGDCMVDLIKNADAAMYRGKRLSRDTYHFFTAGMHAETFAAATTEHDLR